jgi:ferritin-like metal-binding protein YciE
MPKQKNLRELFHDTLKDIYFAEKKILTALPKMAKAAQSEELKAAFHCDAIMGIIGEGQEVMKEYKGTPALDAGLLAAAQAVEHYEILPLRHAEGARTWLRPVGRAAQSDSARRKEH